MSPSRREFLAGASAAAAALTLGACQAGDPFSALPLLANPPAGVDRFWIGPQFWTNRFQDWRLRSGRILATPVAGRSAFRTLAVLTTA